MIESDFPSGHTADDAICSTAAFAALVDASPPLPPVCACDSCRPELRVAALRIMSSCSRATGVRLLPFVTPPPAPPPASDSIVWRRMSRAGRFCDVSLCEPRSCSLLDRRSIGGGVGGELDASEGEATGEAEAAGGKRRASVIEAAIIGDECERCIGDTTDDAAATAALASASGCASPAFSCAGAGASS